MTEPIDVAYVDIVARDKTLKKTRKDIDNAFDDIDKDINGHLKGIDDAFDDAFVKIDKHFESMTKSADESFTDVTKSAREALHQVEIDTRTQTTKIRKSFQDLGSDVDRDVDGLGRRLARGLGAAFDALSDGVKNLLGFVGQLASELGKFAAGSPLLLLIVALIPAIIALAAALSNLLGVVALVPAGIGVLLATFIPLVVAFQNFGEAVAAISSGDIDKINEALKKLSPSAQLAAREIGKLLPQLRAFQRVVQEAFFSQLQGDITQLATGLLPVLTAGFQRIAASFSRFASQFIDFLTSGTSLVTFNQLFESTGRIIDTVGPSIIRLFDALAKSTGEALPFIERIASAFGRALDSFAAFINQSIETGEFDKFIEDAFTTVKELVDLLKAVGGLFGTIFSGTEESGHELIRTLTELTNQLNAFFKSAEGQQALEQLSFLVKAFGQVLLGTVTTLEFLSFALTNSLNLFEFLGRSVFEFVGFIGDLISQIPAKLGQLGDFIGNFFDNFTRQAGDRVTEFGSFLASIPRLIGDAINGALDAVLRAVGVTIGLILFAVQELPNQIVLFLQSLPERIGFIFDRVKQFIAERLQSALATAQLIVTTGFNALVAFVESIPDRITLVMDTIKGIFTSGFDAIVAFISSVPSRIGDLAGTFLQAGKNLIQSFMNGFRSVGSFIGDIAGDIVSSVKGFLNKAIDRINSGIAAIDAVLPGDLARIPRLAAGAVIRHRPGGILANVGEGSEDEVVSPLSELERIISKFVGGAPGAGASVNFGPGAISVNFSGVVPTADEARSVGTAVGEGVIGVLARRGVQLQVRTI